MVVVHTHGVLMSFSAPRRSAIKLRRTRGKSHATCRDKIERNPSAMSVSRQSQRRSPEKSALSLALPDDCGKSSSSFVAAAICAARSSNPSRVGYPFARCAVVQMSQRRRPSIPENDLRSKVLSKTRREQRKLTKPDKASPRLRQSHIPKGGQLSSACRASIGDETERK
jgi:hypothetical protein